ncbi:SUMF1/EgtB/PvdO family nonheme iron enzyme [uncultured Paraglaciecola sp.]|uniref:SUMF1/EgtB/PvdO family nonheme iron enzyme n=1 Tax=uncultured Paraglaciecola sp. TaxID=1765024 RepID=UPI002638B799|nr:SUMF1/EgtB/PvdO family nonheme iron enzyme [uncultured Paraglaciecola sp.]
MSLEDEVKALTAATSEQTKASQDLAQEVAGKMGDLDKKADDAIARAEAGFNDKVNELTDHAIEGHKKAIEDASGGRNTILIDDQGNPNIMVRIPRFNYEDANAAILAKHGIDLQLGEGTPTMFLTNGAPRGEVLVAKHLASSGKNGGCSVVGGVQPRTSVNYDAAKALCENKGANWHMMSVHEWAAIALWSLANDTVPRGNTNYGRSHENKLETARRADNGTPGDASGTGRTDTGKGPDTWAHDHGAWGVQDLVGNVWEWLDQMTLKNGQIITTLDNNPSIAEVNWHKHGAYFDSPSDSMSGTGNVGSPILSNSVTKRNGPLDDDSHDYPYMNSSNWAGITQSATYQKIELLRRLLLESEVTNSVTGGIWARNYGNRVPLRGGGWVGGSGAGLGALHLYNARSGSGSTVGFRPAFFV